MDEVNAVTGLWSNSRLLEDLPITHDIIASITKHRRLNSVVYSNGWSSGVYIHTEESLTPAQNHITTVTSRTLELEQLNRYFNVAAQSFMINDHQATTTKHC